MLLVSQRQGFSCKFLTGKLTLGRRAYDMPTAVAPQGFLGLTSRFRGGSLMESFRKLATASWVRLVAYEDAVREQRRRTRPCP